MISKSFSSKFNTVKDIRMNSIIKGLFRILWKVEFAYCALVLPGSFHFTFSGCDLKCILISFHAYLCTLHCGLDFLILFLGKNKSPKIKCYLISYFWHPHIKIKFLCSQLFEKPYKWGIFAYCNFYAVEHTKFVLLWKMLVIYNVS